MESEQGARQSLDRRAVLGLAGGLMAGAVTPAAGAARPSDIVRMDAGALRQAIRTKAVSCVEVMGAYLDHIGATNPKVNAIVALQPREGLLAQARERDAQLAKGQVLGPLHGFPQAPKDLQAVKGIRSTSGSPILKDFVPAADSLLAARMRAAGAIFVGKTNTPEFGFGSHTYNPVYGATHNAFDPTKSAGGSSGGAAVALALRMLPVADGSDYGGSLRNPAGWNNVVGFRTSFGVVPGEARDAWTPSMGVAGPMARNVSDLAMLLSMQAGYDERAPLAPPGSGARFAVPLGGDMKGKRIGWLGDFGGATPCEPGVLATCEAALKTFEAMGCHVEPATVDHAVEPVWQAAIRLRAWQQGSNILDFYKDPAKRALLKPEAVWEVETALPLSAFDITAASTVRTTWSTAVRKLFQRFDYLVAPTAQVFPFPIEEHWPREIAGRTMRTYHEWMQGVLLVTLTGGPSLAVPAGFGPGGLPMGLQIIAPPHEELACLRLGYAYEQASGFPAKTSPLLS